MEYKEEVRKCAAQWKEESAEVKVAYEDKATYEESLRSEAVRQPHRPSVPAASSGNLLGSASFDAVSSLSDKFPSRIGIPRLVESYREFEGSSMWAMSGMGLCSADGCLRLDAIESQTSASKLCKIVNSAFNDPLPFKPHDSLEVQQAQGFHHSTCHELFGHCGKELHTGLASKFVRSFHQFFTNGFYVQDANFFLSNSQFQAQNVIVVYSVKLECCHYGLFLLYCR